MLAARTLLRHASPALPRRAASACRMSTRAAAAKTALVPVADGSEEMEVRCL